jgi:hypothetical protein
MRTLLRRNSLFVAQFRDSGGPPEAWRFTITDVMEPTADVFDFLKRTIEHRRLTRPWCLELRPHDRLVEHLYDGGKRVIQATRESPSLLARGKRVAYGDSIVSCGINLAPEDRG